VRDIVLLFFRKDFPPIAKLVSELDFPSQDLLCYKRHMPSTACDQQHNGAQQADRAPARLAGASWRIGKSISSSHNSITRGNVAFPRANRFAESVADSSCQIHGTSAVSAPASRRRSVSSAAAVARSGKHHVSA
jgi:hypothetical protein